MNRPLTALAGVVFGFAFWYFAPPALAAATTAPKIATAIADLDYVDTSGELRDQSQFHAHMARGFSDALSRDLEASGKFHIASIRCGSAACASRDLPADLQKVARAAGVRFVVFGGFHKMSTLVQWAKIEILDADTGRVVFDRLVTFRNDTEEAWSRAEKFVFREIMMADIASDRPPGGSRTHQARRFRFRALGFQRRRGTCGGKRG